MENPLCKCGCGQRVSKPGNKYVNGHTWKGRTNNWLGKKHTKETRKKMSKSHIGLLAGEKSPFYGKSPSNKTREKIGIANSGENNGNWKGGYTEYCPIFNNKEFRRIIHERDSNTCLLCGCTRQLNFKLHGKKQLTIHHINHNKKDCDLRNCVSVCVRCNGIVEGLKIKKFYEEYLSQLVTALYY